MPARDRAEALTRRQAAAAYFLLPKLGMTIGKLALIGIVGFFVVKNWGDLPAFSRSSPEKLAAEVQQIEAEIAAKGELARELRNHLANQPPVGSVVSRSACGATVTVAGNSAAALRASISEVEASISDAKEKLAKTTTELLAARKARSPQGG